MLVTDAESYPRFYTYPYSDGSHYVVETPGSHPLWRKSMGNEYWQSTRAANEHQLLRISNPSTLIPAAEVPAEYRESWQNSVIVTD